MSLPSLRVKSGEMRVSVGSDVPVLGAVQQLDKNGNLVQSVEDKPSLCPT